MKYAKKRYLPKGFTLVEIMVSMVIALIVMGGVYQTLVDENVNQDRSEKILDMQNNARLALERVARDVRRAGSLGCGGSLAASTLTNSVTTNTTFINDYTIADDTAVPPGLDWTGGKSILSVLADTAAPVANVNYLSEVMGFNNNAAAAHTLYQVRTDALTLVYLSEERVWSALVDADNFTVDSVGYGQGDILYVTDCENFSLFQKTNGPAQLVEHTATGLNNSNNLNKPYGTQSTARVFKLNTSTYFIHDNGKFELCLNDTGQQIASNIEDLQFEFLADENDNDSLADDPWRTDLASYPTGARAVRAVRIWVLAMSEPDYSYTDAFDSAGNKRLYVYPNSPYAVNSPADLAPIASPPDGEHRHRYLATAVVYLRNAGLS